MNYWQNLHIPLHAHQFAEMAMDFFDDISIRAGHEGDEEAKKRYYKAALEMARLSRWIERQQKKHHSKSKG